jgi:hypothetical protein
VATSKNGSSKRKKSESLREIYARLKKEFTAADLQKYTEIDEVTVPLKQVIAEMKAIQREGAVKRKRR